MKILLVINNLGMGGAENMLVRLADNLADKGHTIKIAIFSSPVLVKPRNTDIEVINYNTVGKKGLPKAFIKLRQTINTFNPDVVHSHLFRANFISRLVRLTLPFSKLICTEHSTSVGGLKQIICYRATDMLTDITTNVSEEAVESYIRSGAVPDDRVVSVPNGVDTTKFSFDQDIRDKTRSSLAVHNNEKMLLAVGRLSLPKNYTNLLYSISLIKESIPNFKLFIVGDGPLKDELQELKRNLKIESCVEFLGQRQDISNLMQACDLFVLSSSWEGLPMVILEAMACQRVVVSTKCGGIEKLIQTSGFIVDVDDSEALAHKIKLALSMDDKELLTRGLKARKHILDNHTIEMNTNHYIQIYNQEY